MDRPRLQTFEMEAWNAFGKLSSRRQVSGMGSVSGILYTEILAYVDEILQIQDPEDRDDLIELIDYLDTAFLKSYYEKQAAEQKRSAPSKPVGNRPTSRPPPRR